MTVIEIIGTTMSASEFQVLLLLDMMSEQVVRLVDRTIGLLNAVGAGYLLHLCMRHPF